MKRRTRGSAAPWGSSITDSLSKTDAHPEPISRQARRGSCRWAGTPAGRGGWGAIHDPGRRHCLVFEPQRTQRGREGGGLLFLPAADRKVGSGLLSTDFTDYTDFCERLPSPSCEICEICGQKSSDCPWPAASSKRSTPPN